MGLWESIPVGGRFTYDGNLVKKTGFDTFEDSTGIECQFQPIFAAKIGLLGATKKIEEPTTDTREWITDPQTRVQTRNPNFGKPLKKKPAAKKKSTKKAAK